MIPLKGTKGAGGSADSPYHDQPEQWSAIHYGVGALVNGGLGGGSVPAPAPAPFPAFTPHVVAALNQTLSITDPSAVAAAGSTLSSAISCGPKYIHHSPE